MDKYSVGNELQSIQNHLHVIKQQNEYEKIDAFDHINIQSLNIHDSLKNSDSNLKRQFKEIDKFYYLVVEGIVKMD